MKANDPSESPGDRIGLLLARMPELEHELEVALLLSPGENLPDVLRAENRLSLEDLVAAADVLSVPVTVLTGQESMVDNLAVSLRLGLASDIGVPEDALGYAEMLLRYRTLLDTWLPALENSLARLPVGRESHFATAGETTANRVRDALSMGDEPVVDLVGLVERCAIPVSFRPLPENLHGLNVRQGRTTPAERVIIVSTGDFWTRQRYTLAHELCHGLYDDEGQIIVDRVEGSDALPEIRAESFARHLLLPKRGLTREFQAWSAAGPGLPFLLTTVMVKFGVSKTVALKALVADGHLTENDLHSVTTRSVSKLMAESGRANDWASLCASQHESSGSPLIVQRALDAYSLGVIDISVVADLLGQDLETTARELSENGWQPDSLRSD